MSMKKQTELVPSGARDPFALMRQMLAAFDGPLDESGWPSLRWPTFRSRPTVETATWFPEIDVFERDHCLVTRIDLPGMKKDDVKVEVADGYLAISGERKKEVEEKKDQFYRCEREYGHFYREIPLPGGARIEDVNATFSEGVLEVSLRLAAEPEKQVRKIEIRETSKVAKTAA
jgi:HSP20 family protein